MKNDIRKPEIFWLSKKAIWILPLLLPSYSNSQDQTNRLESDYIRLGRIKIHLVKIPPGTFQMGNNNILKNEQGWSNEAEYPTHRVAITKAFWMGKFSITQSQWQEIMGSNPSSNKGVDDAPVEQVSWNDTQAFISKLNSMQSEWTLRLPTEAEWEYACRAGDITERYGKLEKIEALRII